MKAPMQRSAFLCALLPVALLAGCASGPAPRVTWLGDGVFKSPTPQDAEKYCGNFGAPMRYLSAEKSEIPVTENPKTGEVVYRCD